MSQITNRRVFLAGGLGNQLFQYAFAHFLSKYTSERSEIINLNTRGGLPHTKQIIDITTFECSHCTQTKNWGKARFNSFINPWLDTSILNFIWGETLNLKRNPFEFLNQMEKITKYSSFVGYFQNKEYILASEELLASELSHMVAKKMPTLRDLPKDLEILHIRQGDTNTAKNIQRVGVLSGLYYESILKKKSQMFRIVVTDDLSGAQETLANLDIDLWLGPEDLSAQEALALMSRADRLITANSTLSWWAGFLAVKNQKEVIIPEPFFKSKDLQAGEAFHYPNFKLQESVFIRS